MLAAACRRLLPRLSFWRERPSADGLLRSISGPFWCKHFGEKDRGTITIKTWEHTDRKGVSVGQNRMKVLDKFCYLGGEGALFLHAEPASRIVKTPATFGRSWNTRDVRLSKKLSVFKYAVIPVLLYNCKTLMIYRWQIKQLDSFNIRCLRRIGLN